MSARVGVVIPTRRRASWLDSALASAAAQTFTDFEVVVACDGLDDATREVVERWAATDQRYHWVDVDGRGGSPGRVRNVGLAEVRSELVAFLDDDDEWLPHKLETQVPYLDDPNTVACSGQVEEQGERSRIWPDIPVPAHISESSLWEANVVATSTVVARTEAVRAAGGFDSSLRTCEDYDLWIRMAHTGNFRFLEQVLARYRIHQHNISGDAAQLIEDQKRVLQKQVLAGRLPEKVWKRRIREIDPGLREPSLPRYYRWLRALLGRTAI